MKLLLPQKLRCIVILSQPHIRIGSPHGSESRFAAGLLGELTQLLSFEMVDAAVEETNTVQKRLRDVPSRVVIYLLLAAWLFPEAGYSAVWAKLTAGLWAHRTETKKQPVLTCVQPDHESRIRS